MTSQTNVHLTSLQSAAQSTTDRGEFGDLTRSAAGDTPARMPESQKSVYPDMPMNHKLEAEPVDPYQCPHSAQSRAESADTDLAKLFAHLHRGGDWSYWFTLPDRHTNWWPVGKPSPIPSNQNDVYFGVHPSLKATDRGHRSSNADIAAVNTLYAEFDAKDHGGDKAAVLARINGLSPTPSVIIDSGGGYHCYWLLTDPFLIQSEADRERARRLQSGWVALMGGDDGAKDLARVLRVPGTLNNKYDPPRPVSFFKTDFRQLYRLEDLEKRIPPSASKVTTRNRVTDSTEEVLKAEKALDRLSPMRADRYQDWIAVGMALSELGDAGLNLWESWSAQSAKFKPGECAAKWKTFVPKKPGGVTLASLYHWADEDDLPVATPAIRTTSANIQAPAPADDQAVPELLGESADDNGNALCVQALFGAFFLFTKGYGWMRYAGTHWTKEGADAAIDQAIIETLKLRHSTAVTAQREAIIKATKGSAQNVRNAKYLLTSLLHAQESDFDSSPDHLNVANGVLDLRTGELAPHDSGQRFTYCLSTPYDPNAKTDEWDAFALDLVGGDESLAIFLQMAFGYILTGHTSEERLIYLYGPTRSGKGTLTETMMALMGQEPLATEAPFSTFTRNRENDANSADLASLKPCRLVVASESGRDQWMDAAELKRITGGNRIRAALKFRDHFSYRPQFKIVLSSNIPPKVDVDDDAAWGRIWVIHCPNSHLGNEDKSLKAKMRSPEMLVKMLAWCVQGSIAYYNNEDKGLTVPPRVEEDTDAARNEIDFVAQWLEECVVKTDDPAHFVDNPTLHGSYSTWCVETGTIPKTTTGLTQALKAKSYQAGELRRLDGTSCRGCVGIRLKVGRY